MQHEQIVGDDVPVRGKADEEPVGGLGVDLRETVAAREQGQQQEPRQITGAPIGFSTTFSTPPPLALSLASWAAGSAAGFSVRRSVTAKQVAQIRGLRHGLRFRA
jgi:hypothetical protein